VRGYALPNDGPVNEADLSTNHQATIAILTAALAAERALANQLADALSDETRNGPLRAGGVAALAAWEEARREQ
jgi:ribosomal protein L18